MRYAPVSATPIGSRYKCGVGGNLAVFDDIFFEWLKAIGNYRVTPVEMVDVVLFNFVSDVETVYDFKGNKMSNAADQVIGYRHADNVEVLDGSEHSTVVISDALRANVDITRPSWTQLSSVRLLWIRVI